MALIKDPRYRPIIYGYLKKYQEDPSSRIFAPLAEAYRKAGLVDEALEIAREGLRVHPNFIGGRVALARALFEKQEYLEVIEQLSPIIQDAPDNLVAQRLLAESFLMAGRVVESLGCYKMLLYYSPNDIETGKIVQELESQAYSRGTMILRTDPEPGNAGFEVKDAQSALVEAPDRKRRNWVKSIEKLQTLLQKVERYRYRYST